MLHNLSSIYADSCSLLIAVLLKSGHDMVQLMNSLVSDSYSTETIEQSLLYISDVIELALVMIALICVVDIIGVC